MLFCELKNLTFRLEMNQETGNFSASWANNFMLYGVLHNIAKAECIKVTWCGGFQLLNNISKADVRKRQEFHHWELKVWPQKITSVFVLLQVCINRQTGRMQKKQSYVLMFYSRGMIKKKLGYFEKIIKVGKSF